MVRWAKQSIMLYAFDFKKWIAHISILLNGFSIHQKLKTSALLSNHCNDPEIFDLVKAYQVHSLSTSSWKLTLPLLSRFIILLSKFLSI